MTLLEVDTSKNEFYCNYCYDDSNTGTIFAYKNVPQKGVPSAYDDSLGTRDFTAFDQKCEYCDRENSLFFIECFKDSNGSNTIKPILIEE